MASVGLGLASPADAEVCSGTAEIEFDATSTLHDFTGTAPAEAFVLEMEWDGSGATLGGTATVAVAKMDTRHAKRDENLRKMFAADRYPLVSGALPLTRIDLAETPASLPIQLTIRDRTRTVAAFLSNWQPAGDRCRFDLAMTLSLREFGLEPPVLLGFIRVGDAVAVRAHVALERPAAADRP
ncbi:MAG TPA: YceI family protein [Kiritimatiellia bacterium]|nr:YceI family protein [Kiritimatiellia bacterium]